MTDVGPQPNGELKTRQKSATKMAIVFEKIVSGEIPSYKLFKSLKDLNSVVILNLRQDLGQELTRYLVLPKQKDNGNLFTESKEDFATIMQDAFRIWQEVMRKRNVNATLLYAGREVNKIHGHICELSNPPTKSFVPALRVIASEHPEKNDLAGKFGKTGKFQAVFAAAGEDKRGPGHIVVTPTEYNNDLIEALYQFGQKLIKEHNATRIMLDIARDKINLIPTYERDQLTGLHLENVKNAGKTELERRHSELNKVL